MPCFGLLQHRYVITWMAFFGNMLSYCMRMTINIGLLQMNQHPPDNSSNVTLGNSSDTCPAEPDAMSNSTTYQGGDFNWDSAIEGQILGSLCYGYMITQIPAGFLAGRLSAKILYACGIFATGLFCILCPVAAKHSYQSLVALRALMGLAQGVCFPLLPAIFGRWAPPQERTRMLGIASAGTQAGTVTAFLICGALGVSAGWESMFYFFGAIGMAFTIPWMLFVFDSPESHPTISGMEKSYIISSIGAPAMGSKSSNVPWMHVVKSPPFWALMVVCWCSDWGFYTLLSDVPLFLKDNMHFSLTSNSQLSALPYAVMCLVVLGLCPFADIVIKKSILSVTNLRKVSTIMGSIIPGLLLIGIPYVGCNKDAVVALLAMSIGLTGIASLGFRVNFNDISPSHAGLLYAIANTCSTTTGFIGPQVTGILTPGALANSIKAWQGVFNIAASLYFFAALVYAFLASGELQPWDNVSRGVHPVNQVVLEEEVLEGARVDMKARRRRSSMPAWIPPPSTVAVPEPSSTGLTSTGDQELKV